MEPFTCEFLFHPAALEMGGNKCTHNCFYCFAKLTKQSAPESIVSIINRLKRRTPKVFVDFLYKQNYPICISNKTDPFAKSNQAWTKALTPYLVDIPNGLFIQTKGGDGIEDFIKAAKRAGKKNIMFYVTITNVNDELCKKLEPNAPNSTQRFELVKTLSEEGFVTMIGLNPLCKEWLPESDISEFIDKVKYSKASAVACLPLYFSKNMRKRLEHLERHELYTDYVSQISKLDYDAFSNDDYTYFVSKKLQKNNITVFSTNQPYFSGISKVYEKGLGKIFPVQQTFMDELFSKYDECLIFFDDYYDILVPDEDKELWERPFPSLSSMFLIRKNFSLWRGNPAIQKKNTLKEILRIYWNNSKLNLSIQNNLCIGIAQNDDGTDYYVNGDIVLFFDKHLFGG